MKWHAPFDPGPRDRERLRAELRGYVMIVDPHGARVVCPWLDTQTVGTVTGNVERTKRWAIEIAIEDSKETTRLLQLALAELLDKGAGDE